MAETCQSAIEVLVASGRAVDSLDFFAWCRLSLLAVFTSVHIFFTREGGDS